MSTLRSFYPASAPLLSLFAGSIAGFAAGFPEAQLSNGQIKVKMFLPDARTGYYRSTRFDWSGAVSSVEYKGHQFYGTWFDRIDPKVINWVHQDGQIVSGPCSGLYGPVDEFEAPLGWNEAKPGGTFIKIGVGVLKKSEGDYDRYKPYDVLDAGKRTVKKRGDAVAFTQELKDPASGYAYLYAKTVRLEKGKPEMVIEHSLKNTGKLRIRSAVYNHNFIVLDKQGPGPDFSLRVPYQIHSSRLPAAGLAEIRGNEVVYLKPLSGQDEAVVFLEGFGDSPKDSELVIENKKVGAGLKIAADRPLIRNLLWSVRTVLAVEPYIAIDIQPGAEFTWKNTFDYYTLPATK